MGINWGEEEIAKNQYELTPPSAQEIVDTINEVDESQKDAKLQRIFFGTAEPSSEAACADRAEGQMKYEIEKQLDALDKGISIPCRVSQELILKTLYNFMNGVNPFEIPKPAHRLTRPINYSHLIRVLCFKNSQEKVGEMMLKYQNSSRGLTARTIREHRYKSEASLKIPPELEDRLYQVAFAIYYRLASTHRLSPYLGGK